MSSYSSSPEPSHPGPIPRGRRGNTCYNCRRRKIKCDGVKPQCTNCSRGGASFEDCEYPAKGGPSQVALLEERIESIKNRIRMFEAPEDGQEISLHQPYYSGSSGNSDSPSSSNSPRPTVKPLLEMSQQERHHHVQVFLAQASQVGFFLSPDQLWTGVLSVATIPESEMQPALTHAVFLWSNYWSSNFHDAREYLGRAVDNLSDGGELSNTRPRTIMHSIQAEVLVSYYCLAIGKTLEGVHHANSALSLVLASGLHRINSSGGRSSSSYLPQCTSFQERNERINAFWAVITLVTHWSSVKHSDRMLSSLDFESVTTPWPTDGETEVVQEYPREQTLSSFLRGISTSGFSISALYVKGCLLLERATSFHTNSGAIAGQFGHLDNLIENFNHALPNLNAMNTGSLGSDKAVVTQLLTAAATIRLHLPYINTIAESKRKSLHAAHSIAFLTSTYVVNDIDRQFLDPIIGAVWMSAAEVLMPNVISGSLMAEEHAKAVASLEAIFGAWNSAAESVEIFASFMVQFEKDCASSFKSFN